MLPIRTLVTGAGSGVGQGIVKALRLSKLPLTIVSSDISPLHSALFRTDESVLLPKVEEKGSFEKITKVIKAKHIDVIMIGSEFDLEFFASHREEIQSHTNVLIVTSPIETVRMANDKWLTAEYLRQNNLPYAEGCIPSNADDALTKAQQWGFPFVLKTRHGTSS